MSAISIGPEYYWNEADYCWNVTVTNNTIRNCGKRNHGDGAIFVHGDGAIGNRNIILRDNFFDTDYGPFIMRLEWIDGVQIIGNRIAHAYTVQPAKPGEVVHLAHIRHATIEGNTVENAGPWFGKTIGGEDVSDPGISELKGIEVK